MNSLCVQYDRFTDFLKKELDKNYPNENGKATPRCAMFGGFIGRLVHHLPAEILLRTPLLINRCARTAFSALGLGGSVAKCLLTRNSALLLEVHPSWERFRTHARYLLAEAFELIGVIVCQCLVIVSNAIGILHPRLGIFFSESLLSTQVQIEECASHISGEPAELAALDQTVHPGVLLPISEKSTVHSLMESLKERRALLSLALKTIHLEEPLTTEEEESWCEMVFELENDLIPSIPKRRISLSDDKEKTLKKLKFIQDFLNLLFSIISERVERIVVPAYLNRLNKLDELCGVQRKDEHSQEGLEKLQGLKQGIDSAICRLHLKHDPDNSVKTEISKLSDLLLKHFIFSLENYLRNPSGSILNFKNKYDTHFFQVHRLIGEIEALYSYETIGISLQASQQEIQENFLNPIIEKINACMDAFASAKQEWELENYTTYNSMDKTVALEVLGLQKEAESAAIKKAYHRLALLYHPDKNKGEDARFKIIQNAYETLLPK